MHLGRSLEIAIALKGISNNKLAKHLKQAPQTVSSWKRSGNIKQSTLVKICEYFKMEVSEFVALGEKKSS